MLIDYSRYKGLHFVNLTFLDNGSLLLLTQIHSDFFRHSHKLHMSLEALKRFQTEGGFSYFKNAKF